MLNFEQAKQYAFGRLEKELSPNLIYHNPQHTIGDVVPAAQALARGEGIRGEELNLLLTAACYHDLGFVEVRAGHESVSARIVAEVLPGFGYSEPQIEIILGIIKATVIPQSPVTLLEQIMADADLDVLGRDDFESHSEKLRRELAIFGEEYSDKEWLIEEIKFVEPHVYFTATAHATRDAGQARNLSELKVKLAKIMS